MKFATAFAGAPKTDKPVVCAPVATLYPMVDGAPDLKNPIQLPTPKPAQAE